MDGNILNSNNEFFLYEYVRNSLGQDTDLEIHPAVSLSELVNEQIANLSADEMAFVKRTSRVDFAISKGYGSRKVIFVIESDSTVHDMSPQKDRDRLKDGILKKSGVYVLHFRNMHYEANAHNERFIDAILTNIRNQEFIKALGIQAWEDAQTGNNSHHPLFVVLPYEKEYQELVSLSEDTDGQLEILEEWCVEKHGTTWSRQALLRWDNKRGTQLNAATGRCSEKEFVYGAEYVAERIAQMGCLYKHLINKKILKSNRRPFLHFLDDSKTYDATYDCNRELEIIEE